MALFVSVSFISLINMLSPVIVALILKDQLNQNQDSNQNKISNQ